MSNYKLQLWCLRFANDPKENNVGSSNSTLCVVRLLNSQGWWTNFRASLSLLWLAHSIFKFLNWGTFTTFPRKTVTCCYLCGHRVSRFTLKFPHNFTTSISFLTTFTKFLLQLQKAATWDIINAFLSHIIKVNFQKIENYKVWKILKSMPWRTNFYACKNWFKKKSLEINIMNTAVSSFAVSIVNTL